MVRTMIAIAAGYFSIAALNSFIHIITSIYFRADISLTGISHLPSTTWIIGITFLQFAFGLFGGLLATTIAKNASKVILGFILIMVAVSLINYSILVDSEPLWYLITAPVLTISGIYMGYHLQTQESKNNSNE
jgi:ABC-type multidrug transport system permease subunit